MGNIMIQGTMSNAGKSILTAGLCRVLRQDGYRTAPFKSQNMALNSCITKDGLEMGRAQVMQAEAAGIEPQAAMNPILLKPTNDTGSQVILNGRPVQVMSAKEYYVRRKEYIPAILEAYHTLEQSYDVIVIEGAGSPAEINLRENDIVNMGLANLVDAPVLLAGDIDRGGVFAQLYGTVALLEEEERQRIKGMIINKFRGDVSILEPGLRMLEEKTGIPVTGVVPWFYLDLDDEDSLTERFQKKKHAGLIDIAVIRFPRISNFTDFAPLETMEEVTVRYVASASELGSPDLIFLPGSKNTIQDLLWMRQNGLEAKILQHAGRGGIVFGICGGYQMLGRSISDPEGAEQGGTVRGMGLLPVATVFRQEKRTVRVSGRFGEMRGVLGSLGGTPFTGYEIHMGRTVLEEEAHPLVSRQEEGIQERVRGAVGAHAESSARSLSEEKENGTLRSAGRGQEGTDLRQLDGAQCGNVYGCYIHGIFDEQESAGALISALLKEKGYDPEQITVPDWRAHKEDQYDRLADIIRESLDMDAIYRMIERT